MSKDKSIISHPSPLLINTHTNKKKWKNRKAHEGFVFRTKSRSQRARKKQKIINQKKKRKKKNRDFISLQEALSFFISLSFVLHFRSSNQRPSPICWFRSSILSRVWN